MREELDRLQAEVRELRTQMMQFDPDEIMRQAIEQAEWRSGFNVELRRDEALTEGGANAARPFDTLGHTATVVYLRNVNYLYGWLRLRGAWTYIATLSGGVTFVSGGDYDGQYSITASGLDMCVWMEFNNKDSEITLALADLFPSPSLGGTKWDYTEAFPLWYFPWDGTNSRVDWANRIDLRHSWQTVGF